jgi:ribonuclease Y
VATVKIEEDELKGRIIGKEGRNIRAFEQYGGVDIIIDDTPNLVQVSSFNPIRREIAVRALKKLIEDKRIQPARIEQELIIQEQIMDDNILEIGHSVVDELKINDMAPELIYLIGKLKFRTSYSQNVLAHSIEVAKLSGEIANELNLDSNLAIRAGLLHDIGKAIDFEQGGNHVLLGTNVAMKYGENALVVNAIAAHHEDEPKTSIYAEIVAIADGISASRPGARNNLLEDFLKRMNEIERICNEVPGVVKTYALQSGRQIRVIVNPTDVSDYDLIKLTEALKEKIRTNVIIPGDVTLTVIRESRETLKF